MTTPANRTVIQVARGTYANLSASIADLFEGEICYAKDQNVLYVVENNTLTSLDYSVSEGGQTAQFIRQIAGGEYTGEPMGHADRTDSSIFFDNNTRVFTIQPTGSSFDVWCKGVKYQFVGPETVTIPNTTGLYYIYFDANGDLQYRTSYFDWPNDAPTAYIYWNATAGAAQYIADERHGIVLDWQTHEYLHRTRGAVLANGFSISNYTTTGSGTVDSDAQIDLGGGTFFDEDLEVTIVHSNTPTSGTWEQDLVGPALIPVLYLSGTEWYRTTPVGAPLKIGTTRAQYNLLSGSSWSTVDADANKYVVTFLVATNNLTYPVLGILGQDQYTNIGGAEEVNFSDLVLTNFPSVEFRPLYKLVYQVGAYGNTYNARLVSVLDLRAVERASITATIASDHGLLSGLGDDDHLQYVHVSEDRTITANHTVSGTLDITNTTSSTSAITGALTVSGGVGIGENLYVGGDFYVTGTTTFIDTQNLQVEDKNIEIGKVASPSDTTANGGGLTLLGNTSKTITWQSSNASWAFSENIDIASGKDFKINGTTILSQTTLGGTVVDSSLTSVGTITTGVWNGSVIPKAYLDSSLVSTGDTGTVTSTMIADGTIVNADISNSAAIVDSKLATIGTADKVLITALNIDGATDIGGALTDADLIIVDDGGAGTNRKAAVTRITDYTFGKVSGDVTITSAGVATIANDSHTHDGRYYTETESDARFLGISAKAADSNLLDGIDSSSFLRSDADDTTTGTLTLSKNDFQLAFDRPDGTGQDWRFYQWASGLNIYPSAAASDVFFGRDGSTTHVDLWNGGLKVAGTTVLNNSRQLSNVTYGGNTIWHAGNDGSGSGLDADLLDGQQGSHYLNTSSGSQTKGNSTDSRANALTLNYSSTDTFSANSDIGDGNRILTIQNPSTTTSNGLYAALHMQVGPNVTERAMGDIKFVRDSGKRGKWYFSSRNTSGTFLDTLAFSTDEITYKGNTIWHAGNDGSGSGLDADLLDGQQGSYYQPASSALTTSTTFGGDVSGTYNAIVVANDSHTHDTRYYTETESDARYLGISAKAADSNLLDGIDSGSFLRSDVADSGILDLALYTGSGFDASNYLSLYNNTNSYGRVGLNIYAKTFNGASTPSTNDGWSLTGPRSSIKFNAYLSGDTGYDPKFTIQHLMANGSSSSIGDLGILAKGYSTSSPALTIRADGTLFSKGNTVWHAGNDGSGSGLDADLLDGQQGSYYQPASSALTTSTTFGGDVSGTYNAIVVANDSHTHDGRYYTETESDARFLGISAKAADSNLLDGLDSGSFLRSDANDTASGVITLSGAGSDRLYLRNTTNAGEVGIGFTDEGSATQNGYFRFRHADTTSPGSAYGANFEFSTDQSNLAVIIDGSGDYFVGTSKVWHAGNDGSGSGLDADTVDGYHFLQTQGISAVGNFGQWQVHGTYGNFNSNINYWGWNYVQGNTNAPNTSSSQWYRNRVSLGSEYGLNYSGGHYWLEMAYPRYSQNAAGHMWLRVCENGSVGSWTQVGSYIGGNVTWHAGNDGSGSGLDADLLDGLHSSSFFRSDTSNAVDVRLASANGRGLRFWDSDSYKIWMSSATDATWGGRLDNVIGNLSDYNMYFRMSGGTNRGFVFKNSTTNIFQIESSGQVRAQGQVIAPTFKSTANPGTAPFEVSSTSVVTNLNADLLDGQHGSYYAAKVHVQEFTSSGTWTKPTDAKLVYVEVIGGGGGGGGGLKDSSFDSPGGGGGAGGMALRQWLTASSLGSTVSVIVGAGGAGGSATTDFFGNPGSTGGNSSFGTVVTARGGNGGDGADITGTSGGIGYALATNTTYNVYLGNAAGGNGVFGNSGNGALGYYNPEGPGGGGAGGGLRGADGFQRAGGQGGGGFVAYDNSRWGQNTGGGGTGAPGGGYNGVSGVNAGDAGGGGGAGKTVSGGNGGSGAFPGGGGGGGGSTYTGTQSGAGGAGANGVVRVYTYF